MFYYAGFCYCDSNSLITIDKNHQKIIRNREQWHLSVIDEVPEFKNYGCLFY